MSFLVKWNLHHHPHSDLNLVSLSHQNIVPDSGRDSTLILHDISFKKRNSFAMDISKTPTLKTEGNDSTIEHESFAFETPHVSCSLSKSQEFVSLITKCFYEDRNHLLILISKVFERMVVDAFLPQILQILLLHYGTNLAA
jgi:hypothetical protein